MNNPQKQTKLLILLLWLLVPMLAISIYINPVFHPGSKYALIKELEDGVHVEERFGKYYVTEDFTHSTAEFETRAEAEREMKGYLEDVAKSMFQYRARRDGKGDY